MGELEDTLANIKQVIRSHVDNVSHDLDEETQQNEHVLSRSRQIEKVCSLNGTDSIA